MTDTIFSTLLVHFFIMLFPHLKTLYRKPCKKFMNDNRHLNFVLKDGGQVITPV